MAITQSSQSQSNYHPIRKEFYKFIQGIIERFPKEGLNGIPKGTDIDISKQFTENMPKEIAERIPNEFPKKFSQKFEKKLTEALPN